MKEVLRKKKCELALMKHAAANAQYVEKARLGETFKKNRIKYEILRNVHQLEKGMSINHPKAGFGIEKAKGLVRYIQMLGDCPVSSDLYYIKRIGISALKSYINLFINNGWNINKVKDVIDFISNLDIDVEDGLSGTVHIQSTRHTEEAFNSLKDIAISRHSIRDFSDASIDPSLILQAISIAQRAPSACNRQAVKYYIVDKTHFETIQEWLGDIGYFGDYGFDKLIIVTGVITAHNEYETFQHLVSPGIAVGYLLLSLEALNIGACVMQRHIFFEPKWEAVCEKLMIPKDEQCFCLIGCGEKKKEYNVPRSARLPIEYIARIVE